jgi:hypothetical protein
MNKTFLWILALIIVAAALLFALNRPSSPSGPVTGNEPPAFDQSISDGKITVAFPSKEFGLATNPTQVLVHSYIPPCSEGFDYCLYYIGDAYTGTNFESAGIRVQKRTDLSTERICLDTPPEGYDASTTPAEENSKDAYSTSVFVPLGDAGAGHFAQGALYRLFVRDNSACYELETRVGETQYANYPAGSIKEFTSGDRSTLQELLKSVIDRIALSGGTHLFP